MLTKAILTGGVLAVLAGSIVYFGTDGADAVERDIRVEETELAGAAESVVQTAQAEPKSLKQIAKEKKKKAKAEARAKAEAEAEANSEALAQAEASAQIEPPAEATEEKPKTRWLDQYLKSGKKKKKAKSKSSKAESETMGSSDTFEDKVEVEVESEVEGESHRGKKMMAKEGAESHPWETKTLPGDKIRSKKIIIKMDGDKEMVWTSSDDVELEDDIDTKIIEGLFADNPELENAIKKEVRIIRMGDKKGKGKGHHAMALDAIDYDAVLVEAKKLQVIDMRNEAFLEIIDYAIDRGDIGDAADILEELSRPELRDTARGRIGVGLASAGDMNAAFAVLDEIEIDELTAPIRLEIITALMATRAERSANRQPALVIK